MPIFWLATEDHDFAEVDHVWIFDAAHHPVSLRTEAPAGWQGKQRPAGGFPVEHPPIAELRKALAGFAHGEEIVAAVADSYQPGVTMGAGFRALLVKLLGRIGMLVLDPLDPKLRAVGAPFMAEALAAAPDLKTCAAGSKQGTGRSRVSCAGQRRREHVVVLFARERRADYSSQERCRVRGFQDRAADVSPNALLRPVWQDYLFPTVAYVGGPAELAYFAQSQVIYDRLLGRMPVVVSRASFTLLDARAAKLMGRYSLTIPDTLTPEDSLKERIAHALIPEAVASLFEETSAEVTRRLDRLGAGSKSWIPLWQLRHARAAPRFCTSSRSCARRPNARRCAGMRAHPRNPAI